jgi:hypothetical protein
MNCMSRCAATLLVSADAITAVYSGLAQAADLRIVVPQLPSALETRLNQIGCFDDRKRSRWRASSGRNLGERGQLISSPRQAEFFPCARSAGW